MRRTPAAGSGGPSSEPTVPLRPGTWRPDVVAVGHEMARGWREHRVTGLAAEVAFFGLLSIFPALIAVAAAVGFLDQLVGGELASRARVEVLSMLRTFLTDEAGRSIDAVDSLFERSSGNLLTMALLGSVLAASRGTAAVMRALEVIERLENRRSWLKQRLTAVTLMLATIATTALTLSMFVLGPLLGGGHATAERLGLAAAFATAWDWLRGPVTFAVLVAWASGVLRLGPDRSTTTRSTLPGALLTAVLWLAVSAGLRLYLAVAGAVNQVFGILGGALIIVVWIYLLSLALLLGAELNAALAAAHTGPASKQPRIHHDET